MRRSEVSCAFENIESLHDALVFFLDAFCCLLACLTGAGVSGSNGLKHDGVGGTEISLALLQ